MNLLDHIAIGCRGRAGFDTMFLGISLMVHPGGTHPEAELYIGFFFVAVAFKIVICAHPKE